MGYRVPKRTALITFEGTDYDGAELECRLDVSLETLFGFQRITTASSPDEQRDMFERFGEQILLAWNLDDDDGNPIPANGIGFLAQPPAFATLVLTHWAEAAAGVPAPLGRQSSDGNGPVAPLARTAG